MKGTPAVLAALVLLGQLALQGQIVSGGNGTAHLVPQNLIRIDASKPVAPPETGFLHLGGKSTDGHDLEINSRYLTLDGKPWLPVMGEFHFSRYPSDEWEDEILKMKSAGVNIIATYVSGFIMRRSRGSSIGAANAI